MLTYRQALPSLECLAADGTPHLRVSPRQFLASSPPAVAAEGGGVLLQGSVPGVGSSREPGGEAGPVEVAAAAKSEPFVAIDSPSGDGGAFEANRVRSKVREHK